MKPNMKKINMRKLYYHVRHRYFTMNNVVIGVALVIGMGWAWASVQAMQRNYALQKEVDNKERQQKLIELETDSLKYQQNYYRSAEYQELAVRERLGFADPGEKVLILPSNSELAKSADKKAGAKETVVSIAEPTSNFQQWMNFLFGANKNR
jgi:cell division protein FtsB